MRIFNVLFIILIILVIGLVLVSDQETNPLASDESDAMAEDIVDATVETAEDTTNTIEDFIDRLTITPQTDLVRVLLVVGGVILLIAGWRVYDYIVIIAGFLIGASVVVSLVSTDSTFLTIAALLIGGVIGAILGSFLYYFAVFIIGAYIGILLTNAIGIALSLEPITAIALVIGAIIGGIVLIGLSFELLVILSSVVGAQMLTLGLGLDVYWTLIFAVIGIVIQFTLMRNFNYNFRRRSRRTNLLPRFV